MLWISNSDLILELYFPSVSKRWKIQYFYDHRGISPFQEWFNFELDEEQKALDYLNQWREENYEL
jgi:hypothetical protein